MVLSGPRSCFRCIMRCSPGQDDRLLRHCLTPGIAHSNIFSPDSECLKLPDSLCPSLYHHWVVHRICLIADYQSIECFQVASLSMLVSSCPPLLGSESLMFGHCCMIRSRCTSRSSPSSVEMAQLIAHPFALIILGEVACTVHSTYPFHRR